MTCPLKVFTCCALAFLFLLAFSPLRLEGDSLRLLAMALPAATGNAYGQDQFPPFYPHLLCALMKAGCCNGVVLIFINIVSLLATLIISRKILKLIGASPTETLLSLWAIPLSWCMAKHTMLPLSDILHLPFFLGTPLCVMLADRAFVPSRRIAWLTLAALSALTAISIRTAALPLLGVVAIAATGIRNGNIRSHLRSRTFWLAILAIAAALLVATVLAFRYTAFNAKGSYFMSFKDFASKGSISDFANVIYMHLTEFAQLAVNLPASRLPHCVMQMCAIISPIMLAAAVLRWFRWLGWPLMLTGLGYTLEILVWPYTDPRFLLPLAPLCALLVVHFLSDIYRRCRLSRPLIVSYGTAFFLFGVTSWGWLAWQGCLGDDFYKHTSRPLLARDYRNARSKHLDEIPSSERTLALFILKKFDPMHTLGEDEQLDLGDYVKYTGKSFD